MANSVPASGEMLLRRPSATAPVSRNEPCCGVLPDAHAGASMTATAPRTSRIVPMSVSIRT
jgi:hypothetical protein